MKTDVTLQVRTKLYHIGLGVGVLVAAALAWLVDPAQLFSYVPALMMLVVGGSTMLYVAAMILFEKEQGTLNATIVSPLRPSEYLWSKIITLTLLATLESVVMVGGAMLIMSFSSDLVLPNVPLLLAGIVLIGIIYTLVGIVLIVRYDKITEFLIPMSAVAVILQIPFVYFLGWVKLPFLLAIPTSAPTVLMQAAYGPLAGWEWVYGVGYTAVLVTGLTIWAHRAFTRHVIMKVG
jgi:fluoroquinolone transport system permease protein